MENSNVGNPVERCALPRSACPGARGWARPTTASVVPEVSEFSALMIARALLARAHTDGITAPVLAQRLAKKLEERVQPVISPSFPIRRPYFCAGCPHNTSTHARWLRDGRGRLPRHGTCLSQSCARALSVRWAVRRRAVDWCRALNVDHVFQNTGDGTYQHSGLLAILPCGRGRERTT